MSTTTIIYALTNKWVVVVVEEAELELGNVSLEHIYFYLIGCKTAVKVPGFIQGTFQVLGPPV